MIGDVIGTATKFMKDRNYFHNSKSKKHSGYVLFSGQVWI
jgi:hypothetical protein